MRDSPLRGIPLFCSLPLPTQEAVDALDFFQARAFENGDTSIGRVEWRNAIDRNVRRSARVPATENSMDLLEDTMAFAAE